nr:hypothetical protein [uncultured Methanolobus sp.]
MLSLFIFFVLLFGLLGIFVSQYIAQYREAYAFWIEYVVYGKADDVSGCKQKANICSKLESYSREICELSHMIIIIFSGIAVVFLSLTYMITVNIPFIADESTIFYEFMGLAYFSSNYEINVLLAARILAFMLFAGLSFVLMQSNINIINISQTSAIDEKIFDVWEKLDCEGCKKKKDELEPRRLYEIWAEKVNNGAQISSDNKERLKSLLIDKDVDKKP